MAQRSGVRLGHQVPGGATLVVDQTVCPVWGDITLQVSLFGAWGLLLISGRLSKRKRAAANPQLERVAGVLRSPSMAVIIWRRCSLNVGGVDPSGYAVYLDCCRGCQQYQMGSFPPRLEISSSVASDVDEVSDLELVGDLQLPWLVEGSQGSPHLLLDSLEGLQPGKQGLRGVSICWYRPWVSGQGRRGPKQNLEWGHS